MFCLSGHNLPRLIELTLRTHLYGFQPLTIITKRSILDVAVALDPSLITSFFTETVASNFPLVLINKTSKMISYYYVLLDKQLLCS